MPRKPTSKVIKKDQDYHLADWNDEELDTKAIELKWGRFPAVIYNQLKLFIRLNDSCVVRSQISNWGGKVQYKIFVELNKDQNKKLKLIEECVIQQLEGKKIGAKLLSKNSIESYFKSNIDESTIKLNVAYDKTAFHDVNGLVIWNQMEVGKEVALDCGEVEYICIQPNCFWIQENMNMGLSWDAKSIKIKTTMKELVEKRDSKTEDCFDTNEMSKELDFISENVFGEID